MISGNDIPEGKAVFRLDVFGLVGGMRRSSDSELEPFVGGLR